MRRGWGVPPAPSLFLLIAAISCGASSMFAVLPSRQQFDLPRTTFRMFSEADLFITPITVVDNVRHRLYTPIAIVDPSR